MSVAFLVLAVCLFDLRPQDCALAEQCLRENGYNAELALVELLQLMDLMERELKFRFLLPPFVLLPSYCMCN